MERFVAGDVVIVPFPFSDLSASKRRPAVVIGTAGHGDVILCQITSRPPRAPYEVVVAPADVSPAPLLTTSTVRPGKLFSIHEGLILRRLGVLSAVKLLAVRAALRQLLEL